MLDDKQRENALQLLNQYEKSKLYDEDKLLDQKRLKLITEINKNLQEFLRGPKTLEEFKTKNDSYNKKHNYWGFKGWSGQMFFNMVYNNAKQQGKLDVLRTKLIETISLPTDINQAKSKLKSLEDFVQDLKSNPTDKEFHTLPKNPRAFIYFITYFWQIQSPDSFPVYYLNTFRNVLITLGWLKPSTNYEEEYENFYNLNMELGELYKDKAINRQVNWFVEHVFYNYYMVGQQSEHKQIPDKANRTTTIETTENEQPSYDFIPKVISNYIELSLNESNPAMFEEATGNLFKILGFQVENLGQGKGRVPDVIAHGYTASVPYTVIIDCKARSRRNFKLTTNDERAAREYISSFFHDNAEYRNYKTYYLFVSSGFEKIDDGAIRNIKASTPLPLKEISFVTSDALLFLIDQKLQSWKINLDVIEEVLQRGGIIKKDTVQEVIARRR